MISGVHGTPLGICCVQVSSGKLVGLCLVDQEPSAKEGWTRDDTKTRKWIPRALGGARKSITADDLDLQGTPFQKSVWRVLLKIPVGTCVSYHDVAKRIHRPQAYRAVANAVGANPIIYYVPCHRVIRKNGDLGGFSCGIERKKALLALEGTSFTL